MKVKELKTILSNDIRCVIKRPTYNSSELSATTLKEVTQYDDYEIDQVFVVKDKKEVNLTILCTMYMVGRITTSKQLEVCRDKTDIRFDDYFTRITFIDDDSYGKLFTKEEAMETIRDMINKGSESDYLLIPYKYPEFYSIRDISEYLHKNLDKCLVDKKTGELAFIDKVKEGE